MNGTVGSLFTGIRGLDLGLEAAGFRTAWACEADEACRRIIERTAPGLPVYPDVREVDENAPPVDVLCGGFPCPDFSVAGKRLMFEGERAQLWFEFARAVRVLRPRAVVVENVPGLLACLGVVLADLAEAGYVGRWFCLRAADVGAPHRRERVFIVATAAESAGGRVDTDRRVHRGNAGGGDQAGRAAVSAGAQVVRAADAVPDRARVATDASYGSGLGKRSRTEPVSRGAASDASSSRRGTRDGLRGGDAGGDGRRLADDSGREAPAHANGAGRPRTEHERASRRSGSTERSAVAADTAGGRRESVGVAEPAGVEGTQGRESHGRDPDGRLGDAQATADVWGAYEPAVRRWELVLGRPAPRPIDDRGRLASEFVEWMMGFPAGWTDGEKRTARLRMLGNAVQVQVAEVVGRVLREEAA